MEGYLGETIVDVKNTEFKDWTTLDWIEYFILTYGQYDGSHHKQWVLDQLMRLIKGTPVIINLAEWDNGQQEYRIRLGEPSQEYLDFVEEYEEDGEYSYDEGIAP